MGAVSQACQGYCRTDIENVNLINNEARYKSGAEILYFPTNSRKPVLYGL